MVNASIVLALLYLISVGQVFSQVQPTAGPGSLVGEINGGMSDQNTSPIRWLEFMDMENHWSVLGTSFTVEGWVWHDSAASSNWQPVLSRHPAMNSLRTDAHFIIYVADQNNIMVDVGCGCSEEGDQCGNGYHLVSGVGNFESDSWLHLAVSFDGDGLSDESTQTANLYINGELVDSTSWAAQDAQCSGRMSNWNKYADVSVGYLDDENQDQTNQANPSMVYGWRGKIDEIRFWKGVRTEQQITDYHDVGLKGTEENLFAYYQFSPSTDLLANDDLPKQIQNEVGDYLHGLPQPDPTDPQIFGEWPSYGLSSYNKVMGQSDQDEDLPPIPNFIKFESYPSDSQQYSLVDGSYSFALQSLIDQGVASVYIDPQDASQVSVIVTCINNNCTNYQQNWRDFYFQYTASNDDDGGQPSRMYLIIETDCPSGLFDDCGTCEGDNSMCQCVVYHGFQSERMSYILLEWSMNNLIVELSSSIATLHSIMEVIELQSNGDEQLTDSVSKKVVEQQIYELMMFNNVELNEYCDDLTMFEDELSSSIPPSPLSLIDHAAAPSSDGTIPYIPSFVPQ